jgi:hypothetical protein
MLRLHAATYMLLLLLICHLRIAGVQHQRWQSQVASKALCSLQSSPNI